MRSCNSLLAIPDASILQTMCNDVLLIKFYILGSTLRSSRKVIASSLAKVVAMCNAALLCFACSNLIDDQT